MSYTSATIHKTVTSPAAVRALGRISPIYGDAEHFLSIVNAIGLQNDALNNWANSLRSEAFLQTADATLTCWEMQYGLTANAALSTDRRRARLMAKVRNRGAITPYVVEQTASSVSGSASNVTELVAVNEFKITFTAATVNEPAVRTALAPILPAHLIYKLYCAVGVSGHARARGMLTGIGGKIALTQRTPPPA